MPIFHINSLLEKAMRGEEITREEAVFLYREAPLHLLMSSADLIRKEPRMEYFSSTQIFEQFNLQEF